MSLLQVKDLKTYFDTEDGVVKAVDGISYEVNEGETIALVGESGCGKSVSALSILGLVPSPPGRIVDGEVTFDGLDVLRLSGSDMRRVRGKQIAMIFQEPMSSLNPVLSIERQLTEAVTLHLGYTRDQAIAHAIGLLEKVGIADPERRIKQYPHEFSGGMRQRVMIAMAISCEPKLIIADEPTTALDVTTQAQILDLLEDLASSLGMALIIITHNLGIVARYCTRVNLMYAGKIIEQGTRDEIFFDPRHPYTLGLMRSVPRLDRPHEAKLEAIEGEPPDLIDLPAGCSFAPRCRYAIERCTQEVPPLTLTDPSGRHVSACWVAETLGNKAEVKN